MVSLGLHSCTGASFNCGEMVAALICGSWASHFGGVSSCGAGLDPRASLSCGIGPVFLTCVGSLCPVLAGGLSTTGPPRKSLEITLDLYKLPRVKRLLEWLILM